MNHIIGEEERKEEIINLMMNVKKMRKIRHNIFTNRRTEGAFENVITRHLMDDETKF